MFSPLLSFFTFIVPQQYGEFGFKSFAVHELLMDYRKLKLFPAQRRHSRPQGPLLFASREILTRLSILLNGLVNIPAL